MKDSVDYVISWVDPSDQKWQNSRFSYLVEDEESNGDLRYRDWGFLRYWFRCVEKNTPWVRHIYFVTQGHIPSWLNTDNKKLKIIKHEDYIPQEYLPTFNSNVIELFFDRIEGLSEHFVYFNDDMFVLSPMKEEDFFINGLPKDSLSWNAVSAKENNSMVEHIVLNDMEVLEKYFDKKEIQKQQIGKMLSPINGKLIFKSLFLMPWNNLTGIENPHVAQPYLKSTLSLLWEKEENLLKETSQNRFRTKMDYSLWLARYWNLLSDQYVLKSRKRDRYYILCDDNREFIEKALHGAFDLVCLNDGNEVNDFDSARAQFIKMFETMFDEPSSFEKKDLKIFL